MSRSEYKAASERTESRMKAAFYRNPDGREPFRQWLDQIAEDVRKSVVKDIATVELGWPDQVLNVERHGDDLFSLTSAHRDAIGGVHTYFLVDGPTMLLLHGDEYGQPGLTTAAECAEDYRARRRDNR